MSDNIRLKEELGDELCKFCPLDEKKKGVVSVPGGFSAGCEGSRCNEAYEDYLTAMNDNQQPTNAEQQDKCLLCNSDMVVTEHLIYDKKHPSRLIETQTYFGCQGCKATILIPLPKSEARARFRQKPESVEAKMWIRLETVLQFAYDHGLQKNESDYGYKGGIEKALKEMAAIKNGLRG